MFNISEDGDKGLLVCVNDRRIGRIVQEVARRVTEVTVFPQSKSDETRLFLAFVLSGHTGISDEAIAKMSTPKIRKRLATAGIEVTDAKFEFTIEAVQKVARDPQLEPFQISTTMGGITPTGDTEFTLEVNLANKWFQLWNQLQPGSDHVVAGYHPVMTGGIQIGTVNGSLNSLTLAEGDNTIKAVFVPTKSRRGGEFSLPSWKEVYHPFRVQDKTITIVTSRSKILGTKGMDELKRFLLGLLEVGSTYIGVVEGFKSPYYPPDKIMSKKGIRPATPQGRPRGTEDFCAWAYRVLQLDGKLAGAYIPPWFHTEGWLKAYTDSD